ncbi:MAG: hypothetical protein ACOC4E_00930 [Patescibacteria group bacterium]
MPASAASFATKKEARDATTSVRRRAASGNAATASTPKQYSVQTQATIPAPPANDTALRIRPTHDRFAEQYQDPSLRPSVAANVAASPTPITEQSPSDATPGPAAAPTRPAKRRATRNNRVMRRVKRKLGPSKVFAYARATTVNAWIWGWGFWVYFAQAIAAVLAVAFLGIAVTVYEFIGQLLQNIPGLNEDGKIDTNDGLVKTVSQWIIDQVDSLLGFNLEVLNPLGGFFIMHFTAFALGMLTLFSMYLIYTFAFLRPLSGRAAGLKISALLLAIVGYALPLANLLPWFLIWSFLVLRYPK